MKRSDITKKKCSALHQQFGSQFLINVNQIRWSYRQLYFRNLFRTQINQWINQPDELFSVNLNLELKKARYRKQPKTTQPKRIENRNVNGMMITPVSKHRHTTIGAASSFSARGVPSDPFYFTPAKSRPGCETAIQLILMNRDYFVDVCVSLQSKFNCEDPIYPYKVI